MNENKQKYSTSTVLIVIVFLALMIALPPIVRVMYPKEETTNDTAPKEEEKNTTFTDGSMICSLNYANTGLSIVSTANYQNSTITSNTLAFSNPNGYTSADLIESADGKTEFNNYNTILSQFSSLDSNYLNSTDTLTTVTINSDLISTNSELSTYYQSADDLKTYLEGINFTCTYN
ncbi:MAG: hypothetical protein IKH54_06495 [Bacilli bacterium]|nr:hypothetical protein [Bacilli bacterium]